MGFWGSRARIRLRRSGIIGILMASGGLQPAHADDLCAIRSRVLSYVLNGQIQKSESGFKAGEWKATVQSTPLLSALGIASTIPIADPNSFVTSAVHNILAEIYLAHEKDVRIPPALDAADAALVDYQDHDGNYTFWPKAVGGSNSDIHVTRNKIFMRLLDGFENVPPDADVNSLVRLTQEMNNLVSQVNPVARSCHFREVTVGPAFAQYRDVARLPHLHNISLLEFDTGAFLTWLSHEPAKPSLSRMLAPPQDGPRIPLDKNDVDCIVNANVVRMLAAYGETSTPGYKQACELLNEQAKKHLWNSCGNYYPETYWFHYAVARAYHDGAGCLAPAISPLIEHLTQAQGSDGSFDNEVIQGDRIQATAFALGALLIVGDPANPLQRKVAEKALGYLITEMKRRSPAEPHLNGGVFFSGGMPVRRSVIWRSDAFTTSVGLLDLYEAQRWFPERFDCGSSR